MRQTFSIKEKINSLVVVLLPIIITQLSLVSTGFFDTVMAGNVSGIALAGVAIGVNLWMPILNGSIGIISGLTPIISQLYGAKEEEKIINVVIQGLYVATILTVLIIIGQIFVVDSIIASMNLEYEVEHTAKGFLQAISCGILPLFFAIVMRNFIDSLGKTRVTMLITILAVPFNILMNYLFIFGKCGFPELGGIGAGVGSAITYWFMAIMNIVVLLKLKPFTDYLKYQKHYKPNIQLWKEQIKIGLPIGIAIFCEVSIFAAVALFMAEYGTAVIAAHQAAITFAALVYMIPISISMALTIIIGFEIGAKRFKDAVEYTYLGRVKNEEDLSTVYSAANVAVSSSLYETFGQTLIEAQACGCIPVSFNNSGQTDIIKHKENGYLADYLSVESLAKGIEWAMKTDVNRSQLREHVIRMYSENVVAAKYIDLYCNSLGIKA